MIRDPHAEVDHVLGQFLAIDQHEPRVGVRRCLGRDVREAAGGDEHAFARLVLAQ